MERSGEVVTLQKIGVYNFLASVCFLRLHCLHCAYNFCVYIFSASFFSVYTLSIYNITVYIFSVYTSSVNMTTLEQFAISKNVDNYIVDA